MKTYAKTDNFTIWHCYDNSGNEYSDSIFYFEHDEFGDEYGGKVWAVDGYIEDYDGVYSLPPEVESQFLGYM
jgi:hypothetical protein